MYVVLPKLKKLTVNFQIVPESFVEVCNALRHPKGCLASSLLDLVLQGHLVDPDTDFVDDVVTALLDAPTDARANPPA